MQAEFFQDIDSDWLYGCVGPMASHGLLRLRVSRAGSASWELLVPDSPEWDSAHQRIYRSHRVTTVERDRLPPGTPPLPEVPRGHGADEQGATDPIPASAFPELEKALRKRSDSTLWVHVPDAFVFPDFHIERYDRYSPNEVLTALEGSI